MIFLIQAREFKTLLKNFLSFCAGFTVIILPFVIYLAAHGALYDALYGTILFNVGYATQGKIEYELAMRLEAGVIHLMPMILLIFFSTLLLVRDWKNKLAWSSIFVGAMMSILLMNLRLYIHYYMVVVPVMPLLFAAFEPLRKICKETFAASHSTFKKLSVALIVLSVASYACVCCMNYSLAPMKYFSAQYINAEKKFYNEEVQGIRQLHSVIPEDERKSFTCWGNHFSTSHWILITDMKPRERFFMNNPVLALVDPAQKDEWLRNVKKSPPLWILYSINETPKNFYLPDEHRPDPDVEKLLAEKYVLRGETLIYDQVMKLYRLKD